VPSSYWGVLLREKGIEIRNVLLPKISSNEVLVKVKKAALGS
jgi:hypothetical protein